MCPRWILPAILLAACAGRPPRIATTGEAAALAHRIDNVQNAVRATRQVLDRARGAPWVPELTMRLAELLSEEARLHVLYAQERSGRPGLALDVPRARLAAEDSIGTFRMLAARHPSSPLVARALLSAGIEQRQLGDYEGMTATLEQLVREHDGSEEGREALLILGDHAFDSGDLAGAATRYRRILQAPESRQHPLARFKLAWCRVNAEDCEEALALFAEVAREPGSGRTHVQHDRRLDLRREALVDSVYCFSRVREAASSVAWYRERAPDRAAFVAALERLVHRYSVIGNPLGVRLAARELLALAPESSTRLDDARLLHDAVVRGGEYEEAGTDVALVLGVLRDRLRDPQLRGAERRAVEDELERLARDLSTRADLRARDRGDARLALESARAYRAYLDRLPNGRGRRDVEHNLAGALLAANEWFEAGRAHQRLAPLAKGAARSRHLHDSMAAFQQVLASDAVPAFQRVRANAGLRWAAQEAMRSGVGGSDELARMKFVIARALYEQGDYDEAIDRLLSLAHEHPATAEARAGVEIALDAFRAAENYEGLARAGRSFLRIGGLLGPEERSRVARLVEQSEARAVREAGGYDRLMALWRRQPSSPLGEQALALAFETAQSEGDYARMLEAGSRLAEGTPQAARAALTALGAAAAARWDLDEATRLYRRAARVPGAERAVLLGAVADLQRALSDPSGAAAALREALAAAREPGQQRALAGQLADVLEALGDARGAAAALRSAGVDDADRLAHLGLLLVRAGDASGAEDALGRATARADSASPLGLARARYALAELALQSLRGPFQIVPGDEIAAVGQVGQDAASIQESYLETSRAGVPSFTLAALARIALVWELAARRVERIAPPDGLAPELAARFRQAVSRRAAEMRQASQTALDVCADKARESGSLGRAARACLAGRLAEADPSVPDAPSSRRRAHETPEIARARTDAAREPTAPRLERLGAAVLAAGDAHLARAILSRAVEEGGDAGTQNLLGLACARANDLDGALQAFREAERSGLGAATANREALMERALR